jgi:hypothetical protein
VGVHVSRNLLLVGLVCLILGLVLGAGGMAAFTRTQADPTRSTAQRWIDALTAKDTVRMASLYVADAEWRDAALGDDFHGSDVAKEGWDPVFAFSTVKDVRLMTSGDDGAAVWHGR